MRIRGKRIIISVFTGKKQVDKSVTFIKIDINGGKKNMKALIFGAGEATRSFLHLAPAARRIEVTGIVDNDSTKWGKAFEGYTVEPPETLKNGGWDKIIITPYAHDIIRRQLEGEYGIAGEKIIRPGDLIVPAEANLGTVRLNCDYDECYELSELLPDKVICSNRMEEFYLKKSHRVMNKWWHYFEIYETFLHKYLNSEVRFLEIGVFRGGSMQMWRDYFGKRQRLWESILTKNAGSMRKEMYISASGHRRIQIFLRRFPKSGGLSMRFWMTGVI